MYKHTARILLPAPVKLTPCPGKLPVRKLTSVSIFQEFNIVEPELKRLFKALAMPIEFVSSGADIEIKYRHMQTDAWQMQITPEKITIYAGERTGAYYGTNALAQMLFAAAEKGHPEDALDCAEIEDAPRHQWRGFMLDSARQFQNKDFIIKFLRTLSVFRINSFHWHLVDSQGWRYPSQTACKLGPAGHWSFGQYSREDLQEINQCARDLGIRIIPEVDVPGHSTFLLQHYPEYACIPAAKNNEFCLGNPGSMAFIKEILAELMEIFPDSPIIHIGGDEADSAHWEKCPVCNAALKAKNLADMRALENNFMAELANFILSKGRTPMIWGPGIEQIYPQETIIQTWLNLRDTLRFHSHGNKVVHSVHSSLYFDYPANLNEYWESWMVELTEQGVYMTDPYFKWYEQLKDTVLGLEACLWTETAPQHRIMSKLFPRIFAYAESAWSQEENKNWNDYLRRKNKLEASGYLDFIKDI